ncbi:MAG: GNAT family N-acetyltransferase [Clostridia bacterium]|nr:GNAT family N-acetyltransferase [Clostridia bacterium]
MTKFSSEADIDRWISICSDGLIDPATARERFDCELINIDGPDPYRDTYFIESPDGVKVATFTVVPNMWSTGMGYIHMVACKTEYRGLGLGKFMADFSLKKLTEIGKEKIFLLTGDARLPALATYIKAGFLPVNYIDEEGKDMVDRWQKIVNTLKIESLTLLDNDGNPMKELHCE